MQRQKSTTADRSGHAEAAYEKRSKTLTDNFLVTVGGSSKTPV
jgi:hypothetical protein